MNYVTLHRSEVLKAVTMKSATCYIWDVMLYSLVRAYRRLGGMY
jgi:hypothetical protein